LIEITHVDHVSMGASDWKAQSALLGGLFGFKLLHPFPGSERSGFDGCTMQVPGTDIEFEVIAPWGERSFLHRFLAEGGPGLHHIAVEVADIHEAAAELERLGIEPFGGIQDDGQWYLTYIHPRDSGGILWQLFVSHRPPHDVDRTAGPGAVGLRRMDHVSMAVPDLAAQIAWQERVFGFEVQGRWSEDALGYDGVIMTMPNSQAGFEIIAPNRPDSFVQRFLGEHRAGMHHICLEVADVEQAAAALRAKGVEPFGGVIDNGWKKHTFVHPRDSGGILFQLVEEPRP
jgi:methylmalonyl-CoA/ethylmalonyl-CoA epimerase